ncbi:MAG: 2-oxoglutarate oxidoreductase [Acidobacteria bacterium]|nr:2-oxoglutarate oxidoreductase [Acidobacteriota bacterium]
MKEGYELIYERPKSLIKVHNHYCPGCTHGVVHKLLAEVIDELGIENETIGVAPVGCAVLAYDYIDVDWQEAAHGRAQALATGIKRMHPDKYVFTYQGDGDLAAIGTAETVHAANRGENILVVFINNAIYGMTGGQMAPTTLEGQKTSTSPYGRVIDDMGAPVKIADMLALLPKTYYITRQTVADVKGVRAAKKALKKAFEYQKAGKGYCLVEFVANCPSNWKMTPIQSFEWTKENMFPYYPLGDVKTPEE